MQYLGIALIGGFYKNKNLTRWSGQAEKLIRFTVLLDDDTVDVSSETEGFPEVSLDSKGSEGAKSKEIEVESEGVASVEIAVKPKVVVDSKFAWHILRVVPGRESSIMQQVKVNLVASKLSKFIEDISFPVANVSSPEDYAQKAERSKPAKGSKQKAEKPKTFRALYPGYIFMKVQCTDGMISALRNVPGVYGFLSEGGKIRTLTEVKYQAMLADIEKYHSSPVKTESFVAGSKVQIKAGSFKGFSALVLEVDEPKETLHVAISVFKRETKVMVPMADVEKV